MTNTVSVIFIIMDSVVAEVEYTDKQNEKLYTLKPLMGKGDDSISV